MVHVVEVRVVGDHELYLRFSDGAEGKVNLLPELNGEIFEPLQDPAFFAKAELHPELGTAVWPNGADFAPEFLYEQLGVPA